ncbi:uncharacterized protein LOC133289753 [Gastrolobium bilobum]|uniref:uncharacterized protein LOC133289753 n=1 Tax=Gastrolobium bilobum TaxID=150636 RepID=UPI002AB10B50|nr:uncharacterized protein LOC133289753 [Gastrolobium bilobum]
MVVGQNKRIVLVVIFLLCFISNQARARTLKEKSKIVGSTSTAHYKEVHDPIFKPKEDEDNAGGEMFSVDYTAVRRKPPIHN